MKTSLRQPHPLEDLPVMTPVGVGLVVKVYAAIGMLPERALVDLGEGPKPLRIFHTYHLKVAR